MNKELITAGDFAKLARTTKRTVTFYDEKEVLKPVKVNKSVRYYKPEQVVDFQIILLLRSLNFSLQEIKDYLSKKISLKDLFYKKRDSIKEEIQYLQKNLKSIESFSNNLETEGSLISPQIKIVESYEIYFIPKIGPYFKIHDYCVELKSKFENFPQNATFLTIFEEEGYNPENAKMKIGVITETSMVIKNNHLEEIYKEKIQAHKALTYKTIGLGSTLSLLWDYLEKYAKDNFFKLDQSFKNRELYLNINLDEVDNEDEFEFEIQMGIL